MQQMDISGFENYLRSRTSLGEADVSRISSLAERRVLRRHAFLFSEGEVCRYKTFILQGLLYTFNTRPDGGEHILQFSPEQTWIVDAESYDKQIPSRYSLAAVEDTALLLWTKADFDALLEEIPVLKAFSQQLISRAVYNIRERLATSLGATPEERYNDFLRDSPGLLSRLPLRMIAAYLGISLKTLTRIRHAQMQR